MAVVVVVADLVLSSTEQEWKTCTVGKSCSLDRSNTCVEVNVFDWSGITSSSTACVEYNWCQGSGAWSYSLDNGEEMTVQVFCTNE